MLFLIFVSKRLKKLQAGLKIYKYLWDFLEKKQTTALRVCVRVCVYVRTSSNKPIFFLMDLEINQITITFSVHYGHVNFICGKRTQQRQGQQTFKCS